jgi:hypothetical protein
MATDQAGIVNAAAGELGDLGKTKRMTAFTRAGCGSSNVLNAAYDFYSMAKEQMLGAFDWSRARKVKALTAVDADPVMTQWAYKFARPSDCLILRKVLDDSGMEYEFDEVNEERIADETTYNDEYIYTNVEATIIRYTFDVAEERYNVGMAQLHALYLAEHIAPTVVGDNAKATIIVQKLQAREERICKALGSLEGYVEDEDGADNLVVDSF